MPNMTVPKGVNEMRGLVCLDMDRVLVDHLSTWQFVYDRLGINNDESFDLYNQGLLDEWAVSYTHLRAHET